MKFLFICMLLDKMPPLLATPLSSFPCHKVGLQTGSSPGCIIHIWGCGCESCHIMVSGQLKMFIFRYFWKKEYDCGTVPWRWCLHLLQTWRIQEMLLFWSVLFLMCVVQQWLHTQVQKKKMGLAAFLHLFFN